VSRKRHRCDRIYPESDYIPTSAANVYTFEQCGSGLEQAKKLQKRHLCLLITEALLAVTATMMPFMATIMAIASPR
jgi:hypothetical protein